MPVVDRLISRLSGKQTSATVAVVGGEGSTVGAMGPIETLGDIQPDWAAGGELGEQHVVQVLGRVDGRRLRTQAFVAVHDKLLDAAAAVHAHGEQRPRGLAVRRTRRIGLAQLLPKPDLVARDYSPCLAIEAEQIQLAEKEELINAPRIQSGWLQQVLPDPGVEVTKWLRQERANTTYRSWYRPR